MTLSQWSVILLLKYSPSSLFDISIVQTSLQTSHDTLSSFTVVVRGFIPIRTTTARLKRISNSLFRTLALPCRQDV